MTHRTTKRGKKTAWKIDEEDWNRIKDIFSVKEMGSQGGRPLVANRLHSITNSNRLNILRRFRVNHELHAAAKETVFVKDSTQKITAASKTALGTYQNFAPPIEI